MDNTDDLMAEMADGYYTNYKNTIDKALEEQEKFD
jgi:hypothetical protein